MVYKPKISKTENDKKENKSILFLENLFIDAPIQTRLSSNDKTANIDGYIELLDSEGRIIGKIAIQSKTVSKKYQGKNTFPCPTSLFGYAQNTTDIVFLIAVDHSRKVALWKYISRSLLQQNTEKDEQGNITLHFDDYEQLNESNLEDTIGRWQTILKAEIELFCAIPNLCQENEGLR